MVLCLPSVLALAGCRMSESDVPEPVVARATLEVVAGGDPDASLLVARYRAWDRDGREIEAIELDHGHGPTDLDDGDDVVVVARVGARALPVQALDAERDRVVVDLDAVPPGRHALRIAVEHDGVTTDPLEVVVRDHRLESP